VKWLGGLAFAFYAAHGVHYFRVHQLDCMLWACHLSCLAIGIGLVARWASAVAAGVLWLSIGLPFWIYYLCAGGEFLPTSILTHVGGLVVGGLGIRKLGWPRHSWWKAALALVPLHLLCRIVTTPKENVNLAFRIWPGWEKYFPSHFVYLVGVLVLCAAVFLSVETGVRKGLS